MVVDWVELGRGADPLPIQILARQRAPIISHDDAIWIEHRYYLEHELVAQIKCLLIIAYQEVHSALHHPTGITLAWMHARRQYDRLPHGNVLRYACKVRHDQHVDVIASKTLA